MRHSTFVLLCANGGLTTSTTTIRLPPALKARIDSLAVASGQSSHAYMIEALTQTTEQAERQASFDQEVNRRWERYTRTPEFITLDQFRDYAMALVAGEVPPRPQGRKLQTRQKPLSTD